jgi:hypothetical protein
MGSIRHNSGGQAFCRSIKKTSGEWIIETPQGPVKIKIAPKNDFGILDHTVIPAPGVEVFVPMRVVPNSSGSEVIFTLFQQPGMSAPSLKKNNEGAVPSMKKNLIKERGG